MDINKTLRKGYNRSTARDSQIEMQFAENRIQGYKCYFFLKRELQGYRPIRHAKMDRRGYFDYITKTYFATLEEWVADCDGEVDDVMYGRNDPLYPYYCTLQELLDYIGPSKQTNFIPTSSLEYRLNAMERILRTVYGELYGESMLPHYDYLLGRKQ